MKFLLVISFFFISIATISVDARGSDDVTVIFGAMLTCGKENNVSTLKILDVVAGNFGRSKDREEMLGCFIDCFSKKVGLLSADNVLDTESFTDNVGELFTRFYNRKADMIAGCTSKTTTKECGAVGPVIACILDSQ